jgi:hypothetical protein
MQDNGASDLKCCVRARILLTIELRRRANGRSNEHRKRFRAEIMSIYHCCSDIVQKSTDGLSQQGYK